MFLEREKRRIEHQDGPSLMTRSVWSYNLESEFELIRSIIASYSFISMDREFPGIIFQSHPSFQNPQNNYAIMEANVDSMHLIQVGLTLLDCHGNLPTFGTSNRFIWEFNFCEFDVTCHPHAPHSIALSNIKVWIFIRIESLESAFCDSLSSWCSQDSFATIIFTGFLFIAHMILDTWWRYWANVFVYATIFTSQLVWLSATR